MAFFQVANTNVTLTNSTLYPASKNQTASQSEELFVDPENFLDPESYGSTSSPPGIDPYYMNFSSALNVTRQQHVFEANEMAFENQY